MIWPGRLATLCLGVLAASEANAAQPWQIDLRSRMPAVGWRSAPPGFAFDEIAGIGWVAPHRLAIRAPEGNYRVTLTYANEAIAAQATVKAETRRLMLLPSLRNRGRIRQFIVNVRTPELAPPPENAPGGVAVRLKPREIGSFTWDDWLTLDLLGSVPDTVAIEQAVVPTIFLAGDSTVTDQGGEPSASWGQMLPLFFGADVAVANHAESGETLKSFITELRLDKLLAFVKPGDWLLIQFGHNDEKAQWPQTYAEAATTYRAYLRAFIAEARRRGATPILITPPERRNFDTAGRIVPSHGDYPAAVRAVGAEDHVAVIDLEAMSRQFYEALGPERSPLAFAADGQDRTHHRNYGAYELARMVVKGIRKSDPALAAHLARDAGMFDPSRPDAPEKFAVLPSDPNLALTGK